MPTQETITSVTVDVTAVEEGGLYSDLFTPDLVFGYILFGFHVIPDSERYSPSISADQETITQTSTTTTQESISSVST